MTKKKIIGCVAGSLLLTSTAIGITVPLIVNSNKSQNNNIPSQQSNLMKYSDWETNQPFSFNGKVYLNLIDAKNDYYNNNDGVRMQQYIGELKTVAPDGRIIMNDNDFRIYNPNNLLPAYRKVSGTYTHDYNEAHKDYVSDFTLRTKYYDYKGNYFSTLEDAKRSMNAPLRTMGLSYYEVEDVNGDIVNINPLNRIDQNRLKRIAFNWLKSDRQDSKFKVKLIKKSSSNKAKQQIEEYKQTNEISYSTNKQFVEDVFVELSKLINDKLVELLTNNNFLKLKIFLKPYLLKHGTTIGNQFNYNKSNYGNQKLISWTLDGNTGSNQQRINFAESNKEMNLNDLNTISKIFLDRNTFSQYYNVLSENYKKSNSASIGDHYTPKFEYAKIKNDSNSIIRKYFGNDLDNIQKYRANYNDTIEQSYEAFNPKPHSIASSILSEPSSKNDTHWSESAKLTFGVYPYIEKDKQVELFNIMKKEILGFKTYKGIELVNITGLLDKAILNITNKYYHEVDSLNNNDSNYEQALIKKQFIEYASTRASSISDMIMFKEIHGNVITSNVTNVKEYLHKQLGDALKDIEKQDFFDIISNGYKKKSNIQNSLLRDQFRKMQNNELDTTPKTPVLTQYIYDNFKYASNGYKHTLIDELELAQSIDWQYLKWVDSKSNLNNLDNDFKNLSYSNSDWSNFSKKLLGLENNYNNNQKLFNPIANFLNLGIWELIKNIDEGLDLSNNQINKSLLENSNIYITYNDVPLYMLNEDKIYPKVQRHRTKYIEQKYENVANALLANKKENLREIGIGDEASLNLISEDFFTNVSSKLKFDGDSYANGNFVQSDSFNNLSINYDNVLNIDNKNIYDQSLNDDLSKITLPQDEQNGIIQLNNGIKNCIDLYNKSYKKLANKINDDSSFNKQNLVSEETINESVILYNKPIANNRLFQELRYGEIPFGITNLNLSLSNPDSNMILFKTRNQKDEFEQKSNIYKNPMKVHYVYRLGEIQDLSDGNRFNDGIIPPVPDFADPEHLVLENAKRTFILRNDPNYVIYEEKFGSSKKYTTLLNRIFFGFKVKIKDVEYVYNSRDNADRAVTNFIMLNSYKLD